MRILQVVLGLISLFAVGAYLWGYHLLAALLGWVVFPSVILADFIIRDIQRGRRTP